MNTSEFKYGQENNVLTSFNKSNLSKSFFSCFDFKKLKVLSSIDSITKALNINLHNDLIVVKIDWNSYKMKQIEEEFELQIKYNNKIIDSLSVKIRIIFIKIYPTLKISVITPEITWKENMIAKIQIEPDHPSEDNWKYREEIEKLTIPNDSNFELINTKNNLIQFSSLKRKEIKLKFKHVTPIMPITRNRREICIVYINQQKYEFTIVFLPNKDIQYKIEITRLTKTYTVGSNKLNLWKFKICNDNPYAVLDRNNINIHINSEIFYIQSDTANLEYLISLRSNRILQKTPSDTIKTKFGIEVVKEYYEIIDLYLSTEPNYDIHYINIIESNCLQILPIKNPFIIYKEDEYKYFTLNLKNISPNITVENLRIKSKDTNIQFDKEDIKAKTLLKPNQCLPLNLKIKASEDMGIKQSQIEIDSDYAKKYKYELTYAVKSKKECSLNIYVIPDSVTDTFIKQEYNNLKVCEVLLKACEDAKYGIEGSLPIKIKDLKLTEPFRICTNNEVIKPNETVRCDICITGTIETNKKIILEYNNNNKEIPIDIKSKRFCKLETSFINQSHTRIFTEVKYTEHKICKVVLKACKDEEFGIVGSLPIKIKDIKLTEPFILHTNNEFIKPDETIECDVYITGTLKTNKKIMLEYNNNHKEIPIDIKSRKYCTLKVSMIPESNTEIFANETYENLEVCRVKLKACANEEFGIEGSFPIKTKDIQITEPFLLNTVNEIINPNQEIECKVLLYGSIQVTENVNSFNKHIIFNYVHE